MDKPSGQKTPSSHARIKKAAETNRASVEITKDSCITPPPGFWQGRVDAGLGRYAKRLATSTNDNTSKFARHGFWFLF
jgi:hypothetical protein